MRRSTNRCESSPSKPATVQPASDSISATSPVRRNSLIWARSSPPSAGTRPVNSRTSICFPATPRPGQPGKSQLEAKSFTEYLERYVAEVKPQFLSYDNYMVEYSNDLRDRRTGANYFRDLVEVRRVSLEHDLPFWNIVTCVQIRPGTTHAVAGEPVAPGVDDAGRRRTRCLVVQVRTERIPLLPDRYGAAPHGDLVVPADGESAAEDDRADRQPAAIDRRVFHGVRPLDNAPALPGKLIPKLDADGPLMIGEFASSGRAPTTQLW